MNLFYASLVSKLNKCKLLGSLAETFRRKSKATRIEWNGRPVRRTIPGKTMSAKFATRQNLQMERVENANTVNSKSVRDAVFKSPFRDQNR